ncbi:MAG: c-type cytochrome [Dehalococcoidia bacterium]|nr:c-type cytochrome [Dehalococcoidia bacterium]
MNHGLEKKVVTGLALTILLIIMIGVYFITEPARQRFAREEFTRKASFLGAELYLVNECAVCHGEGGEGGVGPTLRDTELEE